MREAAVRLAGWLYGNRPHVSEHEITDPSGSTTKLRFNNSALQPQTAGGRLGRRRSCRASSSAVAGIIG